MKIVSLLIKFEFACPKLMAAKSCAADLWNNDSVFIWKLPKDGSQYWGLFAHVLTSLEGLKGLTVRKYYFTLRIGLAMYGQITLVSETHS